MIIDRFKGLIDLAARRFFYALFLSFIAGSISALAMPPVHAWYLLPITFTVFYALLAYAPTARRGALIGWGFGFGYFVFGLYWIGNALLVDGNPYAWAWPLAVSGLPAVLACFWALTGYAARKVLDLKSASGFLAFIGLFALFEWLRGHLFTGFPWNLFAYTWSDFPQMYQSLFLTDSYMLSLLSIFWAATLGFLLISERPKRMFITVLALTTFAANFAYGAWRVNSHTPSYHQDIQVKVIQPNIPQAEKWQRDKMAGHFFQMLEQSKETESSEAITYIIWPETALNFWFVNDPGAMTAIREMLHSYQKPAYLMTGLLRHTPEDGRYYNSLVTINKAGEIQNIYDKSHLVPFGEYIPFQNYIPLAPIVRFTGFVAGSGPMSLTTQEGLKYSPLICYETLFPHKAIDEDNRPDFILNVTNDAWYGDSAGPRQHLTKALYRAVETGIPVIRSANTGISTIFSPLGTTSEISELFNKTEFVAKLPIAIQAQGLTSFAKQLLFFLLTSIFITFGIYKKRPNTNSG